MNLDIAWNRLSARLAKRDIHHTIGRFNTVRKTYSLLQKGFQSSNSSYHRSRLNLQEKSLFPNNSPEQFAQKIKQRSVAFGLQLTCDKVAEIHEYACQNFLYEPGFEEKFKIEDVVQGRLSNGRNVMRGLVEDPGACPAIDQIARDPLLMEIARQYLGYWPSKVTHHLTWTFVSKLPEPEQRDRFLPLSYHYDVAGYNFISTYFYITDMDRLSGAHVMIEQSHARKPFHTLFAPWSGRQTDEQILSYYGSDLEILIEGKAGYGFVQDPSCFHKLLPPATNNRLIFQVRYA
ncbi:MAG: hypothetical protein AAF827_07815 [Cyanobacteria bacterium P01_D01_bin.6]